MRIESLINIIDSVLPPETSIQGDRTGLQIQSDKADLNNFLITLEITDEVIDEAIELKSDCIITFHPLIYYPITIIKNDNRVSSVTKRIIKNDISVIAVHTNFDAYINGTSQIFAEKLNLFNTKFLVEDNKYPNAGMGITGEFESDISAESLLELVSSVCLSPLRYNDFKSKRKIRKIAIVGGSGSSFIEDAIKSKADAFITADISYHNFHRVNGNIMLIDPGHYEMEQFVPEGLKKLLAENIESNEFVRLLISSAHTNPVRYYPETEKYRNQQKKYIHKFKGIT